MWIKVVAATPDKSLPAVFKENEMINGLIGFVIGVLASWLTISLIALALELKKEDEEE